MKDLNNKNKGKIQNFYEKIKGLWWFLFIVYFLGIFSQAFIVNSLFQPESPAPDIKIVYNFVKTVPRKQDATGYLRLDMGSDENIFCVQLWIINKGEASAKNFEFQISTSNKTIELHKADIFYVPPFLEKHVIEKEDLYGGKHGCYRKLDYFSVGHEIYIEIFAKKNIKEEDLHFEFSSKLQIWRPKKGEIDYKQKKRFWGDIEFFNTALAEQTQKETKQEKRGSGVLIGGYDPLILTNNLFKILQKEKLITPTQANEIKEIVENEKKGVLFGGINIIKFNEAVLNALIHNEIFSKDEVSNIIQKSRDAGGVLIGGFNIIVLEIEIMNLLIKKKNLDLNEGQLAVDTAKSTK